MKKLIITSLTVLAFAMTFTGCGGGSAGGGATDTSASSSNDQASNSAPTTTTSNNSNSDTNAYGVSRDLGTPPSRPAS